MTLTVEELGITSVIFLFVNLTPALRCRYRHERLLHLDRQNFIPSDMKFSLLFLALSGAKRTSKV
jgi:hypothetical protein